jgi:hypothetical protein
MKHVDLLFERHTPDDVIYLLLMFQQLRRVRLSLGSDAAYHRDNH